MAEIKVTLSWTYEIPEATMEENYRTTDLQEALAIDREGIAEDPAAYLSVNDGELEVELEIVDGT